jgi:hypothetical protein
MLVTSWLLPTLSVTMRWEGNEEKAVSRACWYCCILIEFYGVPCSDGCVCPGTAAATAQVLHQPGLQVNTASSRPASQSAVAMQCSLSSAALPNTACCLLLCHVCRSACQKHLIGLAASAAGPVPHVSPAACMPAAAACLQHQGAASLLGVALYHWLMSAALEAGLGTECRPQRLPPCCGKI